MNFKNVILIINTLFIFIILSFFVPNYRFNDLGATCFIVYPFLNIGIALFKKDWKVLQFLLVVFNLGVFVYSIFASFMSFILGSAFLGGVGRIIIFSILLLFYTFLNLIYSVNFFRGTKNSHIISNSRNLQAELYDNRAVQSLSLRSIFLGLKKLFRGLLICYGGLIVFVILYNLFIINLINAVNELRIGNTSFVESNLSVWYENDNHLCTIKINGKDKRCLNDVNIFGKFVFSSDGQKIIFNSKNKQEIFYLDTNSFDYKKLSSSEAGDSIVAFDFSPNQNFVSYSLYDKNGNCPLFIINNQNDSILKIDENIKCFSNVYWDKEDKSLYYIKYSYDVDGNNERQNLFSWDINSQENKLLGDLNSVDIKNFYSGKDNSPFYLYSEQTNDNEIKANTFFGSVYLNNKKIFHFYGYDSKFRTGFRRPQWLLGNRYVIFENGTNLYIADAETNKFGKLTKGSWASWFKARQTGSNIVQ